ncbi:Catechol 2,3-dioxygenase [Glycomyces sambucus]|uniref:Catechol 2,3-dioxygenase n=1 Tax=Glycomyces sambucus TaxID=380244 RepID=A0A1G9LHA3_9ACTN|nr:VOC family protein [Glycomyces sambucus]SDL61286.1 Catechol 2,3-dioxygenase [Glycomyces sambucus]
MPSRQPPRPAPRPTKAPSRGGAKGGAARGGAKGAAVKGGAKGAAGVRKAAPLKAQPRGNGRQQARGMTAEQLRQQRLLMDQQRRQNQARWWAINQHAMKDLHSRQHHAAGGEAIGTVLNADRRMRWRTSRAIGAITLLILAFFFTSMAIGAQSVGIAVLAFLCLAGTITFFTVEHSARRFPQPVPAPPLIGQHRLEDLIVEDDPPRGAAVKEPERGSLDDLFEPNRPETAPLATPPPAPQPEPSRPAAAAPIAVVTPATVIDEPLVAERAPQAAPVVVTAAAEPAGSETAAAEPAIAEPAEPDFPVSERVASEPVAVEPSTLERGTVEAGTVETGTAEPVVSDPVAVEPVEEHPKCETAQAAAAAAPPLGVVPVASEALKAASQPLNEPKAAETYPVEEPPATETYPIEEPSPTTYVVVETQAARESAVEPAAAEAPLFRSEAQAAEAPPVADAPVDSASSESAPLPADPPAAFTLPSEQIGGAAVVAGTDESSAVRANENSVEIVDMPLDDPLDAPLVTPLAAPPAEPLDEPSPPKGPIAEAASKLRSPSAEGSNLARDLAELLLSEERLGGTDVTDVAATLVVTDLQRSVEFYTDALGLAISDRTPEAAVLDAGFGKILLWERPDAPPGETGIMHLTFEVGDIDAAFTQMNEAGVQFLHLPRTALLGQNYEMRAAAFRDPDGHGLAITEHRERD